MARSNADTIARYVRGEIPDKWSNHTNVHSQSYVSGVRLPDTHEITGTLPGLRSYRTPIALTIDDNTIAINPNTYSISTSAHQSELRYALHTYGYKNTGRTARVLSKVGMHDPKREWAFEIYTRETIEKPTAAQKEAIMSELEAQQEKLKQDYHPMGKTPARRYVRELHEMLSGERALTYPYSDITEGAK